MSPLKDFLAYWQNPPHSVDADPVQVLYHVYRATEADLDDLKSQGRIYIIPGKDSRGRWIPMFDEGKIDDIALLSGDIEATKMKLKTISNDIAEVCALAGSPTSLILQTEHERLRKSIKLAEATAGAAMRRAINGRGRTTQPPRPDELATRPELVEIYAKADILRAESEPKIAEMFGRLEKIREISEKYRG